MKLERKIAYALAKELKEITQQAKLEALAVLTATGDRVAFYAGDKKANSTELSAIGAALVAAARLALERLNFSPINDVMVRGKNGLLIIKSIGDFHLIGGTSDIEEFKTAIAVLSSHAPKIADILSYVEIDEE
ncbi:MAG: hypothetical protein K9W45_08700 [Candidatus Heimdallarchaeum aukensis]|uniref:Roadblock/LAMTOR2 domain-containing protein n=2 Tax=Candidatus Heimdallarchaeum TaxID=3053649 RepID=A0A9Y1BQV7_9ARCH|nr:MAG: hypothetical protein K9W45_08700 [Candidatus Heimdallarchaeum aukensis]UJG42694.1 MAG: hypothetical protein K9W46_09905 [Candidatus Heimdallarchaeum endolithica]